jgi:hypothetical protein
MPTSSDTKFLKGFAQRERHYGPIYYANLLSDYGSLWQIWSGFRSATEYPNRGQDETSIGAKRFDASSIKVSPFGFHPGHQLLAHATDSISNIRQLIF